MPFLIDKIVPEGHYKYWECVFSEVLNPFDPHPGRGRVVVYNGDIDYAPIAHTISSKYGFFFGCRPLGCSSYIVGVKDGNEVDLIDSEQKLLAFIGHIDNLEEVVLNIKANGYWFDSDTLIGGAYRERKSDYLLYLRESSSAPVTYRSVRAILTKQGYLTVLDRTVYRQENVYIIE